MIPVPKRTKLVASEKFDTNATEHPDIKSNENMQIKMARFMSFVVVLPVDGPATEIKRRLYRSLWTSRAYD